MTPAQLAAELLHVWDDQTDRQPETLKRMIATAIQKEIEHLEAENKRLRGEISHGVDSCPADVIDADDCH